MPYSIGDILLKIDSRATSETIYTRHHVMLVVGESEKGFPIIMHMMGVPHWKLVKEELTRGKELVIVHYPWPEKIIEAIAKTSESCLKNNTFILNTDIIKEQSTSVSPYRPSCSLEAKHKLETLRKEFIANKGKTSFNSDPESSTLISCHEWVMNIIHYSCQQTDNEIPLGFQISPHLAWADLLYYSVSSDPKMSCVLWTSTSPTIIEKAKQQPNEQIPINKDPKQRPYFAFFDAIPALEKPTPGLLVANKC